MSTEEALPRRHQLSLASALIGLNVVVGAVVSWVKLPLYLDSIGIVIAALLLPPGWAIFVGVATCLVGTLIVNPYLYAYSVTAVGIALSARLFGKLGLFRKIHLVPLAGISIGVVAAVLSAPVTAYLFGGVTASGVDFLTGLFAATGRTLFESVFLAGIASDPVDKLVVCLLAFATLRSLPLRIIRRFPEGAHRLGIAP